MWEKRTDLLLLDKGDSRKARVSLACELGGTYRHAKNKSNVEALN